MIESRTLPRGEGKSLRTAVSRTKNCAAASSGKGILKKIQGRPENIRRRRKDLKGDERDMKITDVRVRKVAKEGKMKAVVSITIDDEFVVHDIKVIEGEKGLFIAMPSRKASDGEYRDIAHPINSETRERIQKIILEQYETAAAAAEEAAQEAVNQ